MNKPLNRQISDPRVDKLLLQATGRTLEELIALSREDDTLKVLKTYRDGLALWEEATRDTKDRVIVTLDGRDTAGKGSNIKRVTYDLPNSRFTLKAFPKPTTIDRFEHNHFMKFMPFFPGENGGITFFDRSWYNRAGVEAAMGFCTQEEYDWFMQNVAQFEKEQIIEQGIKFIKVYLSVTKSTQKERLDLRKQRIRKRYKISPIDQQAQEKWNYYTLAKAKILELTDSKDAPWTVLDSNEKWLSAVEIIKAIINSNEEVSKIVGKKIDLTPDKGVVRTAKQELARMKKIGDFKNMKDDFHFRKLDESAEEELQEIRSNLVFVPQSYSYREKKMKKDA
ncbi:MAG: hypothetical protein PHH98_00765 [Candidatus Gracilibacteria bacterium]|nr:hypothetical protein [Candidatus Gracilibacteria bacterium]